MKRAAWMAIALVPALALALSACSGENQVTLGGDPNVCGPAVNEIEEGMGHLSPGEKPTYKNDPPTSGKHAAQPAATGIRNPAPPVEQLVHNLEHGHVVVWYRPVAVQGSALEAIKDVIRDYDHRAILVPRERPFLPDAASTLKSTAWGKSQTCIGTSPELAKQVRLFIQTFAGKGPEGDIPASPAKEDT